MPELPQTIGPVLRRARKQQQLTQEQVAERLEVTTEFYARLERGHACPSIRTFINVADLFDLSADELLGRAGDGEPDAASRDLEGDGDEPVMRRLSHRLRHASPGVQRILAVMLDMLEQRHEHEE